MMNHGLVNTITHNPLPRIKLIIYGFIPYKSTNLTH